MAITKLVSGSLGTGVGGSLVKISSATASSDASVEFTTGIDSTYKAYLFLFTAVHPSADTDSFSVSFSTDGGSTYGLSKTASYFRAFVDEGQTSEAIGLIGAKTYGNQTHAAYLAQGVGADADQSFSGELWLYEPASTTYMKNFKGTFATAESSNFAIQQYVGGYINTTSAVNAVKFTFASANVDAGEITMYGVNQ